LEPRGNRQAKAGHPPRTNVVVGAGNNRVYFYNSKGIVREVKLGKFLKEQ